VRRVLSVLVGGLLAAVACSHEAVLGVVCQPAGAGCFCYASMASSPLTTAACDETAFPSTTCCATPGWPSQTTTCTCSPNVVACGVVSGYFSDGSDGCVCERGGGPTQAPGATCFPGGSTTTTSLGICCMFASLNECACGAGLHTCGDGGSPVTTCSAANFPAPSVCLGGRVAVTSCSAGSAPTDAAVQEAAASCTSNADCDPTFQFCDKKSCDASTGTCAGRPGQKQTYYCNAADGGGSVCGCDGLTYPGTCFANAEGVSVAKNAPCDAGP
jgi:hypothetical protein